LKAQKYQAHLAIAITMAMAAGMQDVPANHFLIFLD
jgi:hypothetical protein